MTLYDVAREITGRLVAIFLRGADGTRPVYGGSTTSRRTRTGATISFLRVLSRRQRRGSWRQPPDWLTGTSPTPHAILPGRCAGSAGTGQSPGISSSNSISGNTKESVPDFRPLRARSVSTRNILRLRRSYSFPARGRRQLTNFFVLLLLATVICHLWRDLRFDGDCHRRHDCGTARGTDHGHGRRRGDLTA